MVVIYLSSESSLNERSRSKRSRRVLLDGSTSLRLRSCSEHRRNERSLVKVFFKSVSFAQ
ncbi:hypothetical protein Hdeb2414_s0027g00688851 [Helianthus debilis subsp. tardiflorus]